MSIKALWKAQVRSYNAQPKSVKLAFTLSCYAAGWAFGTFVLSPALDRKTQREIAAILAEAEV